MVIARINRKMDSLRKLHAFDEKQIIIFGCTMWIKTLIDCLSRWNYSVSAIIDNNTEKAGGKCLGIDVFTPEEYLSDKKDGICILICSSYFLEMGRQLENMGFVEETHFFVISYFDRRKPILKSCRDLLKGYSLYRRSIEQLSGKNPWIFVCPYGGSGDIYMAGIFFKEFLKREAIDTYLFFVDGKLAAKTAELMDIKNIRVITEEEKLNLLDAWTFFGPEVMHLKPLLYWGWRVKRYPNPDAKMDITFLEVMKYDVFQLPEEVFPEIPERRLGNFAAEYFKEHHLEKGRTVILAPHAGSYKTDITADIWEALAENLLSQGYCVCTNSSGEAEPVIKGTLPVFFPLKHAVEILDYAGYFIGIRSGFCDITSSSGCRFIVLYERALNAIKYEYFSFKRMGLNPDAREFIYDSEHKEAFILEDLNEFA